MHDMDSWYVIISKLVVIFAFIIESILIYAFHVKPDGCAIGITWEKGGFALWSVFGSLLTCSWSWTGDLSPFAQKIIRSFDWAAEGYQLWMAVEENAVTALSQSHFANMKKSPSDSSSTDKTSRSNSLADICLSAGLFAVIPFVKSSLTVNPSMSQVEHLYLQGEDRLLINFSGESLVSSGVSRSPSGAGLSGSGSGRGSSSKSGAKSSEIIAPLGNSKNWVVVPIPNTYLATNWPIRVSNLIVMYYSFVSSQINLSKFDGLRLVHCNGS